MITTDKPFEGIQPFRLGGGGNHQGTIQEDRSTLINPSRRFNPLGWVGGEPSGYHTGGMINTDKPHKGIQPFRLGGGEPSGYHTGGMTNTEKPLRLGGGRGTTRVPYR